jgi:hypothetical protein
VTYDKHGGKQTQVLEDGTRVYPNGQRYTPKPRSERLIGVNRPDDPRAVRFHTRWFLPLELLPDEERVMPETVPDEVAYEHMSTNIFCMCPACRRPEAERYRRRWRRHHGLHG